MRVRQGRSAHPPAHANSNRRPASTPAQSHRDARAQKTARAGPPAQTPPSTSQIAGSSGTKACFHAPSLWCAYSIALAVPCATPAPAGFAPRPRVVSLPHRRKDGSRKFPLCSSDAATYSAAHSAGPTPSFCSSLSVGFAREDAALQPINPLERHSAATAGTSSPLSTPPGLVPRNQVCRRSR